MKRAAPATPAAAVPAISPRGALTSGYNILHSNPTIDGSDSSFFRSGSFNGGSGSNSSSRRGSDASFIAPLPSPRNNSITSGGVLQQNRSPRGSSNAAYATTFSPTTAATSSSSAASMAKANLSPGGSSRSGGAQASTTKAVGVGGGPPAPLEANIHVNNITSTDMNRKVSVPISERDSEAASSLLGFFTQLERHSSQEDMLHFVEGVQKNIATSTGRTPTNSSGGGNVNNSNSSGNGGAGGIRSSASSVTANNCITNPSISSEAAATAAGIA